MTKKVANDSVAKGDRVVIVLLEGSKNAQANHIKNRIKAIAGLTVTQALTLWPWLYMSSMDRTMMSSPQSQQQAVVHNTSDVLRHMRTVT